MAIRSIPAHAGEPAPSPLYPKRLPVYPRPRGGTAAPYHLAPRPRGLSPPTRGNLVLCRAVSSYPRSIPAHAGEPIPCPKKREDRKVYPRPRGGTAARRLNEESPGGLSPPTRGNPDEPVDIGQCVRSIPAHAGEPHSETTLRLWRRVYPRPRGGTRRFPHPARKSRGLSPPTRGNPGRHAPAPRPSRSIPAHAGEPAGCRRRFISAAVYPRPRGGTRLFGRRARIRRGLSPPTRGNPHRFGVNCVPERSIPAHAGEPAGFRAVRLNREVYPRPRGGTALVDLSDRAVSGLSPPTRGNRRSGQRLARNPRSIPAHAGEPRAAHLKRAIGSVYPRPRGGTGGAGTEIVYRMGLSPPTRGNPDADESGTGRARSIPAHAGEPAFDRRRSGQRLVYPRPRGGTAVGVRDLIWDEGLSPPTRGNRPDFFAAEQRGGSIPAHAGEPADALGVERGDGVYPRPRGGTVMASLFTNSNFGLSPPTRGNLRASSSLSATSGSIPAHAGEPWRRWRS